jgi:ribonuclease HI
MEIRAVVEALRFLPEGMNVCISTDSAYVERGVTEWVNGWAVNDWRTSTGAAVAHKSLWQNLLELKNGYARLEWSWVKVQSGILLSECADELATKGVVNEQNPDWKMQFLTEVGEDTDEEEHILRDGEETLADD